MGKGTVVFTVIIATKNASYEFLFAPELNRMFAEKIKV
jgi:hypothetical protein